MTASTGLPIVWKSKAEASEYERARIGRIFNYRRPKRYPIAIVEATDEDHVVEAVKLAKEHKAQVSVRSGGHSWAAWSVRDNAMLIDFGNFKHMQLDENTNVVTVSPSTTGRVLNGYLATKGLMFPGGHCPDVGVGGFLLQGGMGWNCRSWGWACTRVKAIDVVTADAKKLHCNEKENSDLFWAARGAGPGFPAIVTRFHLQARPLPPCIKSSGYIYPKKDLKKALNWIKAITPDYDTDTENVCVGLYMPQYEESVIFILLVTFKWNEEDAIAALRPAEDSHPDGCLEQWFAKEDSLPQEYCNQADANPSGHRYCCDNAYIGNNEDVAEVLEEAFTTLPTRKAFSLWYAMTPVSRQPLPDMALSMQSDHYFALYTVWEDEKDDERCQAWVRNTMKNVESHSVGSYLGDADFQVRRSRYWSDENGERLRKVRQRWDPEGLICGYLDAGDQSRVNGLPNKHEWKANGSADGIQQGMEKLDLGAQSGH